MLPFIHQDVLQIVKPFKVLFIFISVLLHGCRFIDSACFPEKKMFRQPEFRESVII